MNIEDVMLIGVGERFANANGSSRQEELARCVPGEHVDFVREPDNPRDTMAVAIFTCRGGQIGYLRRDDARWIGLKIDAGQKLRGTIKCVAPRGRPFSPLAITIKVIIETRCRGAEDASS